jgi:hypothetical protein
MTLLFPDHQPFATGAAAFSYRPVTMADPTNRLIVQVEIDGLQTEAVVDTGGAFLICAPELASSLALDRASAIEAQSINIRGERFTGDLYRLQLTLPADEGADLEIEATAFVPTLEPNQIWPFPSFLGMHCCLERARFAVDPVGETFYFGPC